MVRDIRTKKDPTDYITNIIIYSKNTGITSIEVA